MSFSLALALYTITYVDTITPPVPKPTQDVEKCPGFFPVYSEPPWYTLPFQIDGQKRLDSNSTNHYVFVKGGVVPQDACAGSEMDPIYPPPGPQLYQYFQKTNWFRNPSLSNP
ncbi:hypothetical protein JTE90_022600, partial [Oedothorax gibbosus]